MLLLNLSEYINANAPMSNLPELLSLHHGNLFTTSWQFVTSQEWDEITKSWVVTVLQAPADIISSKLIEEMKLNPTDK